jgi:hypothetical protein
MIVPYPQWNFFLRTATGYRQENKCQQEVYLHQSDFYKDKYNWLHIGSQRYTETESNIEQGLTIYDLRFDRRALILIDPMRIEFMGFL